MHAPYLLLSPRFWKDYELIDCGNFEKLERFGEFILSRPEPQAIWDKKLPQKEWDALHHAKYVREKGRDDLVLNSEKGNWLKKPGMKDRWMLHYKSPNLDLNFNLSLTSFGHVGIFPEQAENWEFIYESVQVINRSFKISTNESLSFGEGKDEAIKKEIFKTAVSAEKPKVLNLFAYTGASTLAACAAGADVIHLDSVKQVVNWANENKQSSKLEGITRWLVEDAMKFVQREKRRGNTYHGIILDPPAYGRGPEGEKWLLEQQLNEMVKLCADLLNPEKHFFLLNIYSVGFSALVLDSLIARHVGNNQREIGELVLPAKSGINLPLGTFVRYRKS